MINLNQENNNNELKIDLKDKIYAIIKSALALRICKGI